MNKFVKMIANTSDSVLAKRASQIGTRAEIAQKTIINEKTNRIAELEMEELALLDFAPSTKDDLKPCVSGDWNADEWAKKLLDIRCELRILNIEKKIAEKTYAELFAEIDDETKE